MKIFIRSDSGEKIGLGHLNRDILLAKRLKKEHFEISFAVQNLEGNYNHLIVENGFDYVILENNDVSTLISTLNLNQSDLLVIDHYDIGFEEEKKIKEVVNCFIMVFADKIESHFCDLLLNHNINAQKEWYQEKVLSTTQVFTGVKYHFLNEKFNLSKKTNIEIPKKILVIMGGTDPLNFSAEIVKLLSPKYEIIIATTRSNIFLTDLLELKKTYNFDLQIDFEDISKLMKNADLGIFSASTLISESLSVGLPFIAIKIVENQQNMYNYLKSKKIPVIEKQDLMFLDSLLLNFKDYLPFIENEIIDFQKVIGTEIQYLIQKISDYKIKTVDI